MTISPSAHKNLSSNVIELTAVELRCLEKYHPLHFWAVKEALLTGEARLVEKLSRPGVSE